MADQISLPRAQDATGAAGNGWKAYFYESGTTTPVTVYSDTALSAAVSQPLLSDSDGWFAQTFIGGAASAIKVVITDDDDVTIRTIDPAEKVSTSDAAAEDVSYSPSGTISSTNVQGAIDEIESDLVLSTTLVNTATNQFLSAADRSNGYRCTANVTISLDAAATLGSDWWFIIIADGGAVTIDPDGSETIDGSTTLTIPDGTTAVIRCNGTAFFTDSRKGAVLQAETDYNATNYTTGSTSFQSGTSFTVTPTKSGTKLICTVNVQTDTDDNGGGDGGVECKLQYYDGAANQDVPNTGNRSQAFGAGGSGFNLAYIEDVISFGFTLTDAMKRSDTGDWTVEVQFRQIFSGATAEILNADITYMEVEA